MSQHMIVTLQRQYSRPATVESRRLPSDEFSGVGLEKGSWVLLALNQSGQLEHIEPTVWRIEDMSQADVTLKAAWRAQKPVPVEQVRAILGHGLTHGATAVSEEEFSQIKALLGPPIIEEVDLLNHVKDYISARGYYFDDETLRNYHISLKTRPFVILAGLSGTGKSKLSQLYAEALGHTTKDDRYLRVAVRPSWNDDRYLLGYLNTITGDYIAEPALDFIIQAERDRENLYFFCLDEMNLAHVEYYFSQFLSALEEEETADRRIPLFSRSLAASMEDEGREIGYEREVIIPPNLLFTGTINVDETTQPLSDKVIDRANTIEFFEVDLEKVPPRRPTPEVTRVPAATWHGYRASTPDTSYREHVVAISKILNKVGLGLGYRVLREIEMYLANSRGLLEPDVAFDLQIKQRILPRVRGSLALRDTLKGLIAFMHEHDLPRSEVRLEEMAQRLTRDGYTSFWR